jgi:predicted CXXCH cytochrome family protein
MTKNSAHQATKPIHRKSFPWIWVFVLAGVMVVGMVGGFVYAAGMESHDTFCGSCHTQPESTYLKNSTAAQPADLASYHAGQKSRCIDCHSGQGLFGRIGAEILGATNAVKWYSGTAIQPAPLTQPIGDGNCLKCHQQVTDQSYIPKNQNLIDIGDSQNGHWHLFLSRWQSIASNPGHCVSCHSGHATTGDPKLLYLNRQNIGAVCDACHSVLRD